MNSLPIHEDSLSEDQVESLSDSLAALLVAEWKTKHFQHLNQATVSSPGGCNRTASEEGRCEKAVLPDLTRRPELPSR